MLGSSIKTSKILDIPCKLELCTLTLLVLSRLKTLVQAPDYQSPSYIVVSIFLLVIRYVAAKLRCKRSYTVKYEFLCL